MSHHLKSAALLLLRRINVLHDCERANKNPSVRGQMKVRTVDPLEQRDKTEKQSQQL